MILDDARGGAHDVYAIGAAGVVADRRPSLLIVLALVFYLVSTIVALRKITKGLDEVIASVGEIVEKSAPVNDVVNDINENLDAGVDLLEGLLVKKAGMVDAVGLVDGLYPGAAAAGFRNFPESTEVEAPRISEVYTQGHAHARAARPRGADRARPTRPARCCATSRAAASRRGCSTPDVRHTSPEELPRSPVIGTDSPVQYEQRDDIGQPRKRAARADTP